MFPAVTNPNQVYAFIAYAHLDGIVGVGYHISGSTSDDTVVPVMQDMASHSVALANSYDFNNSGQAGLIMKYNVTFVISTQDYSLSELSLGSTSSPGLVGTVVSGDRQPVPDYFYADCYNGHFDSYLSANSHTRRRRGDALGHERLEFSGELRGESFAAGVGCDGFAAGYDWRCSLPG